MENSFDAVREAAGQSAGPDLVTAIEKMTLDQIDGLAELVLDLPRTGELAKRPVTEIWPLVPLRASLFFDHLNHESPTTGYAPSGIQLSAAIDPRSDSTGYFRPA